MYFCSGVRSERTGQLRGRESARARPKNDGVQTKPEQKLPAQNEGIQVGIHFL